MDTDALYVAHTAGCVIDGGAQQTDNDFTATCLTVKAMVDGINQPYTGNSSGQRLAWLKRRRDYMTARAAVVQGAITQLAGKDVSDSTAQTIKGFGSLAVQIGGAIPGIGSIATLVGTGAQLIAGLFDHSADQEAAKAAELALWQNDLVGLKTRYDETEAEIQALMLPRYILYGVAGLVVLATLVVVLRYRRD